MQTIMEPRANNFDIITISWSKNERLVLQISNFQEIKALPEGTKVKIK